MATAESQSRKLLRACVLALVAAAVVAGLVYQAATWNASGAIFGWNLGADGKTIIGVTPGLPAAKAGIERGDQVDWRTLPLLGRANLGLIEHVAMGDTLRVTVYRHGVPRTVTMLPVPWGRAVDVVSRVPSLCGKVLALIGIALVWLRPSRMTWGFLCSSLVVAMPDMFAWSQRGPAQFVAGNGIFAIVTGISAAGILIFMSRFPADTARGPLVYLDRYAVPLGAAAAALGLYIVIDTVTSNIAPRPFAVFFNEYIIRFVLLFAAVGAFSTTFFLTKGSDRQRVIPVLFSYAFYVAVAAVTAVWSARFTSVSGAIVIDVLSSLALLILTVAVVNGVIRHRVIDVSFAISRTLVFTILTSFVVGAFVLVDFISSKFMERVQMAVVLEVAVALAFGLSMDALHTRVDRFIDRILFRRRHLAETRLARVASILAHADATEFIDEALVQEPADAFDLASAAVFRLKGERFQRVLAQGWDREHAVSVSASDRLIVQLRAELETTDLSSVRCSMKLPQGLCAPLIAIPLAVRHELLGFVMYGGHRGGEAIDPDEARSLERLATAAAGAYDHIEAQALRKHLARIESENAQLRQSEQVFKQVLTSLQSSPVHPPAT